MIDESYEEISFLSQDDPVSASNETDYESLLIKDKQFYNIKNNNDKNIKIEEATDSEIREKSPIPERPEESFEEVEYLNFFEEEQERESEMHPASNVKSEKIVEEHKTELDRINSFTDLQRKILAMKIFKPAPVKIEEQPGASCSPIITENTIKISLNKPNLNAPLVAPLPSLRHYNYKPRAPSSMVVNSVCPSPFPIRKDCCHKCKIIFNHTLDFLLHKYKKHPNKNKLPRSRYKYCRKCFKTYISRKAFQNHRFFCTMRIHNYFECSRCYQGFNDYQMLKVHMQTCFVPLVVRYKPVVTKKTFDCDMCDKKFSRQGGLTQHRNSFHFNIKPYVCRVCGHRYALKGDLSRCRHRKGLLNGYVQN